MREIDKPGAVVLNTATAAALVGISQDAFVKMANEFKLERRLRNSGDPVPGKLRWLESEVKGLAFARQSDLARPKTTRLWGNLANAK